MVLYISLDVVVKFSIPEFYIRFGGISKPATGMAVPVAAIYKDNKFTPGHDDIGLTGQIMPMKPVAESLTEQVLSYLNFWLRILVSDRSHVSTALLRSQAICHRSGSEFWLPRSLSTKWVIWGAIILAISLITGTTTELPNWR